MKKHLIQAVTYYLFFTILGGSTFTYAAPKIPVDLLDNSVIYCTSASGLTFDPQKSDLHANMNVVAEQIYDKLFEFDSHHNRIIPSLVERYFFSKDGLTLTLHLRQNVAFHHTDWFTPSRHFNADDVIFSLNRAMGTNNALAEFRHISPHESYFHQQQNHNFQKRMQKAYSPYFESIGLKNQIESISAPSPYTIKIKLRQPDTSLLIHLASKYAVILSQEYATKLSENENVAQLDSLPVGTGVYQLQSYQINNHLRLKANPHYWGEKAKVPNMIIDFSSNGTGRMAKFLNQECDIAAFPEPSQIHLVSTLQHHLFQHSGANLAFIAFNTQSPALQAVSIRKKIAQNINRQRLAKILFYGAASVADSLFPPIFKIENNDTVFYHGFNFNKEDISPSEPLPKKLKLWVIDEPHVYNPHPIKMAELIRADLAKIGISIEIIPVSQTYLVQQIANQSADYDLILTGWLANNLDPYYFLSPLLSCKHQYYITNLSHWCDENFDYFLENARLTENPESKIWLYHLLQSQLEEQLPILPLVNVNRLLLVSPRVKNASITTFGQVQLSKIEIQKEK